MNSLAKYLISVGVGAAGLAGVGVGLKLVSDGVEEIDDTLFDWRATKLDMYDAAYKGMAKTIGGIGLAGLGGAMVGGAIATSFYAGQDSILENPAPVNIVADTIEDAQKSLDVLKALNN